MSTTDHHPASPRPHGAGTMTALRQDRYGTDPHAVLAVATVPRPEPADGEVLVRVEAASLDRGTWHVMTGLPRLIRLAGFGVRAPSALNPGRAFAGTVERVGAGVVGLAPGDQVWGTAAGALAEFVVARPDRVTLRPTALSVEAASTAPISGVTALQAVRDRARVQAGDRVLVIGASGGVGSFAVQIAVALGAEVTGVCRTSKVDLVRGLGAAHVIDHTNEALGGGPYDAIIDIGGCTRVAALRSLLTRTGRLVIVGGEGGGSLLGGIDRQLRAHVVSLFVPQTLGTFVASENATDLAALRELVEAGHVRPAVDRVLPLDHTADGLQALVDGEVRGKVVVSLTP